MIMEKLKYENIKNICRMCMLDCDINFNKNPVILDIFHKLTDIHFETNDELPQQICVKCFDFVNEIHSFSMTCIRTHSVLMTCLNNYKNKRKNEEPKIIEETNKKMDEHWKIKEEMETEEITIEEHKIEFVKLELDNDWETNDALDESVTDSTNDTSANLLPQKSREIYEKTYSKFMDWRKNKNINSFSENVFLIYFDEISTNTKSSTLWKIYSMLRGTISLKHNIHINNYFKLKDFLKKKSDGYRPKKSKTLTTEEVKIFINDAPNDVYLATKVATIVGIMGACRKYELWQMRTEHIEDLGTAVKIKVPDPKTKGCRKFTITGDFYTIFKQYLALRPSDIGSNHLFLNYQKGRCTKQVIGINKFGNMPKQIAAFLKLPNPELYTGHCFRRTSETILVDPNSCASTSTSTSLHQ